MAALDLLPFYTFDDYQKWEGSWELIYGNAYAMSPAPYPRHQQIVKRVAWELEKSLACPACELYLSPVDWKVSETTVVQPDIAIFCEESDRQYFSATPPLIVEVLSQATAHKDVTVKFELYEKEQVQFYIIIDPESETAEVFKHDKQHFILMKKIMASGTIDLEWEACRASIDFTSVFK